MHMHSNMQMMNALKDSRDKQVKSHTIIRTRTLTATHTKCVFLFTYEKLMYTHTSVAEWTENKVHKWCVFCIRDRCKWWWSAGVRTNKRNEHERKKMVFVFKNQRMSRAVIFISLVCLSSRMCVCASSTSHRREKWFSIENLHIKLSVTVSI